MAYGYAEMSFPGSVEGLENLIPEDMKDDQYLADQEFTSIDEFKWVFKKNCGHRLGSKEEPFRLDLNKPLQYLDDAKTEIDYDDPNIISPKLKMFPRIDWSARFKAAFNQFVRLGIAARRNTRG